MSLSRHIISCPIAQIQEPIAFLQKQWQVSSSSDQQCLSKDVSSKYPFLSKKDVCVLITFMKPSMYDIEKAIHEHSFYLLFNVHDERCVTLSNRKRIITLLASFPAKHLSQTMPILKRIVEAYRNTLRESTAKKSEEQEDYRVHGLIEEGMMTASRFCNTQLVKWFLSCTKHAPTPWIADGFLNSVMFSLMQGCWETTDPSLFIVTGNQPFDRKQIMDFFNMLQSMMTTAQFTELVTFTKTFTMETCLHQLFSRITHLQHVDHIYVADFLIEHGANIHAQDMDGVTPLHLMPWYMISTVVQRCSSDVDFAICDFQGRPAFAHFIFLYGLVSMDKLFCEHVLRRVNCEPFFQMLFSDVHGDVLADAIAFGGEDAGEVDGPIGLTILQGLVYNGWVRCVKYLFDTYTPETCGAFEHVPRGGHGKSLLRLAVESCRFDMVVLIMNRCGGGGGSGRWGFAEQEIHDLAFYAINNGCTQIARHLISHLTTMEINPLHLQHLLIRSADIDSQHVHLLVELGAEVPVSLDRTTSPEFVQRVITARQRMDDDDDDDDEMFDDDDDDHEDDDDTFIFNRLANARILLLTHFKPDTVCTLLEYGMLPCDIDIGLYAFRYYHRVDELVDVTRKYLSMGFKIPDTFVMSARLSPIPTIMMFACHEHMTCFLVEDCGFDINQTTEDGSMNWLAANLWVIIKTLLGLYQQTPEERMRIFKNAILLEKQRREMRAFEDLVYLARLGIFEFGATLPQRIPSPGCNKMFQAMHQLVTILQSVPNDECFPPEKSNDLVQFLDPSKYLLALTSNDNPLYQYMDSLFDARSD